jgi:hypothetical protein
VTFPRRTGVGRRGRGVERPRGEMNDVGVGVNRHRLNPFGRVTEVLLI